MEKQEEISFEKAFEWAVIDNFRAEMSALPAERELAEQYSFSAGFGQRIKGLFRGEKRKGIIFSMQKFARRTAAAAAIALVIFAAAFVISPQVRAFVREMYLQFFKEYATFETPHNNTAEPSKLEPSYIPEGFAETGRVENGNFIRKKYENAIGEVIFYRSMATSWDMAINNEEVEYAQVVKEGINYNEFRALNDKNFSSVVWEINGYYYHVFGSVALETLEKMAFSLK